jgi:hypothetical protein
VKRLLALAVGLFGLRAYLRRRRRGTQPADELREKLAAQRSAADEAPPVAAGGAEPEPEPPTEPPTVRAEEPEAATAEEAPEADVDARRAEVHAGARQKIDELSS